MVYVYVLESQTNSTLYVGMTKNLVERLKEHNSGKSKFTKGHMPWKLIYHEEAIDYLSGRKLEKYFKTAAGKKYIQKKLTLE